MDSKEKKISFTIFISENVPCKVKKIIINYEKRKPILVKLWLFSESIHRKYPESH